MRNDNSFNYLSDKSYSSMILQLAKYGTNPETGIAMIECAQTILANYQVLLFRIQVKWVRSVSQF